jgi:hypothetical protein
MKWNENAYGWSWILIIPGMTIERGDYPKA